MDAGLAGAHAPGDLVERIKMKKLVIAAMSSILLFSPGVFAETAKKEPTPLQIKSKECRGQAKEKGLKGDARKAFVKQCTKPERDAAKAERKKKRAGCSDQAKKQKLAGDERKAFIKTCMKS